MVQNKGNYEIYTIKASVIYVNVWYLMEWLKCGAAATHAPP